MNDRPDSLTYGALVASRYLVRLLIDPATGRLLDASQAAADFYGYSREELRQLSAWDLTPLRSREETLALLAEIAAGRDLSVRPGSQHRRRNGERRDVMVCPDLVEDAGRVLILATVTDVTELRQAQERQRCREERASDQRLGALVEQGLAGVAEADLDGRLTRVNDRFCQILGYSRERLLGRPIDAFTAPEHRPSSQALRERMVQSAGPTVIEKHYQRQDGDLVYALVAVTLLRDATGEPAGFLGLVTDITAHRTAEDDLRATEERLRLALEGAGMGTWHWNLVTDESLWSDLCRVLYGIAPGTPTGWDRFIQSIHPEHRADVERTARRALEEHTDYADEYPVVWPDGSEHWLKAKGRFYFAADGTPQRMEGVVQDITEAKALRQALELEHAHLEDLVAARTAELQALAERIQVANEAAGLGVWEWDLVADQHFWDSRLYALYGLREEDGPPTYANWSARVHPDDLPGIETRLATLCAGQQDLARDAFRIRWPDGTERHLAEVCKIQRDGQTGAALRVYGISWDITDQRRAEEAVRTLNAELETRVTARTTELEATAAALHQSEERFRYAMDATSDGLWDWNSVTGAVYYSPGYARMLGFEPDELAPHWDTWFDLLHPEERAGVLVRAQHPLENSGFRELDFRMRTKAGGYRWVLSRGKVIERAADGTPLRVVGTHIDITERKETELALRRYRQIVECSSEKLVFLDRDLRYQVVNPAYAAMYHCTPEALQGRAMAEVAPPAVWVQVHPHLEAVMAGEPQRFQMEAIYPDGYSWYLEAQAQPFWEDGQVQGIVASLHDLTEMRAVQAALEAERAHLEARVAERTAELQILAERLHLATDAGRIGVFDMDLTTGQILWDARLRTLYGVPDAAPELSWQTWLEWVAPAHRGGLQDSFARLLRGEATTYQGVLLVHCPDGQDRYIASRARLLNGPTGLSQRLVGVNWDMTAERQAVAALEASEAKARAIIDASPMPIAIIDAFGPVRYLNAAFVRTFGYTLEDLPTWEHWRRLAYPDPVERARILQLYQERLAQIERTGESSEPLELAMRCKDGRTRIMMASTTALGGEQWLNTGYDITDLKQAQAAAEQAARAKSEFLAHMSHEIRTPLNSVLGLLQVLERSALAPDQRAMVAQVLTAGRSLLGILNDILDLSKIEAGQLPLNACPFGLAPLLAEIGTLLGSTARDKGLVLDIAPPPTLDGGLVADPQRLEQVLVNLIGNAIKFTDRGEVRVRVSALERTAETVRLRFEVRDTGIGIAPETLPGLFHPFTQADASITRRFGGTGLGLAICKHLVDAMGGAIGAESRPGEGSTFWFEVPFQRTAEVPPWPLAEVTTAPAGPRLTGLHLLVVDDSAMNREMVERMLALEGARATLVEDGRKAVERLRTQPTGFDAVLMDVQMPIMDGLTATHLIRTELGLTELPILALTAGVLTEEQAAARAAGVSDVLPKPLELEALVSVVRQWVRPGVASGTRDRGQAPDQAAAFPEIPGLDRDRAAQTVDHDLAFFRRLLERFCTETAGVVAATRRALDAGERETAIRRMHTLKGHAGTLGALEIMAAAGELEEAMRQDQPELDTRLAALDPQVAALIAASTAWLEATRAAPVATMADAPPLGPPPGRPQAMTPEPNILIVDDDPAAIQALHQALPGLGRIYYATSGKDALAVLAQSPMDVVLLDANMPGMDGFATCRAIGRDYPRTPVIFVTADSDFTTEVRALEAGAQDFIGKPFNPPVVRARVSVHLELQRSTQALQHSLAELQDASVELERLASTDKLTGAWNRRRLEESLINEQERLRRYGHPLSLMILDIDHFKEINDTYGHLTGDRVLAGLATTVLAGLRATDSLTRWGGEEFIILCPTTALDSATLMAERLRQTIATAVFPTVGQFTVSIGVAECLPGEGWEHWLKRADDAMYRAKANGRNQVQTAPERPDRDGLGRERQSTSGPLPPISSP